MNRKTQLAFASAFFVTFAFAIGALLALRAARDEPLRGAAGPSSPYRGSRPPAGIRIPRFSLRSYTGRAVSTESLHGRVALVTFLDSKCTDKCPIIATTVAAGLGRIHKPQRKQIVAFAITVNPKIDTPKAVRRFLQARRALGQLDFLLGSVQQLQPLWRKFGILSAYETGNADVHSADLRVFDRRGYWVSTMHAGVDLTPANVAHDAETALARSS